MRHHPSHQIGHGVFNFADHHRRRIDPHGKPETRGDRTLQRAKKAMVQRSSASGEDHFRKRVVFPPRPHVTAFRQAEAIFPRSNRPGRTAVWAQAVIGCCVARRSPQKAGLHRKPGMKMNYTLKKSLRVRGRNLQEIFYDLEIQMTLLIPVRTIHTAYLITHS